MRVLRTVSTFERCSWHPGVMSQAIEEMGGGAIAVRSRSLTVTGQTEPTSVLATLESVMMRYMELQGFDPAPQLYTMAEAAEYLGISTSMMETYVTRRGEIKGSKIGRSWVFAKAALDHWQATQRRAPGRPPAEAEGDTPANQ
jgi:excisionase family DNA binding protein